jgi:hypothetical protein
MANYIVTPNMNLPNGVPGQDPGPDYANNQFSATNIIDQHNHSAGQGVQIQPNGINISSDLPFNGNNAINLTSVRLNSLTAPLASSAPNVGCIYVSGNELYYNDYSGGHQVKLTSNGLVNATSSGISSGTASASFSAGTLVVLSSSSSYANIDMQSAVLSNSGNLTNQLTLSAPTLSSSYSLTLPSIPGALSFLQIDTSGNISAGPAISGGLTSSNLSASAGIVGTQLSASAGIVGTQLANSTITSTEIATNTVVPRTIASPTASAGEVAYSGSSGLFTTSSTTPVLITNQTVTLTTTGNPIFIGLLQDGTGGPTGYVAASGSSSGSATFYIKNGGSILVSVGLAIGTSGSFSSVYVPPGSINTIDFSGAGTYTYTLEVSVPLSSYTAQVSYCRLVAYEL